MGYAFERAFKKLILIEGGYVDHPYDNGGKTKYGITEKLKDALGYECDIAELTEEQAKEIYKSEFWNKVKGDEISQIAEPVAHVLF